MTLDLEAYRFVRRGGVVALAESRIHADGKGSDRVADYWRTVNRGQWTDAQVRQLAASEEWCQVFVLACYHDEYLTQLPWRLGTGFAMPRCKGPPEPGDRVIYYKYWHGAIVVEPPDENGRIVTIDGNQSPGVERRERVLKPGEVYSYCSITPWIDAQFARARDRG
jgi:hypothetical protein